MTTPGNLDLDERQDMFGPLLVLVLLSTSDGDSTRMVKSDSIPDQTPVSHPRDGKISVTQRLRLSAEGLLFCVVGAAAIANPMETCFNTLSATTQGCMDKSPNNYGIIVPYTLVGAVFVAGGVMMMADAFK